MLKSLHKKVFAFDCEWIPDPEAGRLMCDLDGVPDDVAVEALIEATAEKAGVDPEDAFVKTALSRIVSICGVLWDRSSGTIKLVTLPPLDELETWDEAQIIHSFLAATGRRKPQIVGYASSNSDLKIIIQRALKNNLTAPAFCSRPNKPWEGADYFNDLSDFNIDLCKMLGGWGNSRPSLNEMCTVCGIPGKMDVDGSQVKDLWLEGRTDDIIRYNQFDALSTFLLFLRVCWLGGHVTEQEYIGTQEGLQKMIVTESEKTGQEHLQEYLAEWSRADEMVAA